LDRGDELIGSSQRTLILTGVIEKAHIVRIFPDDPGMVNSRFAAGSGYGDD
jgi:hypothetical protein